jgi:hypothetical protein
MNLLANSFELTLAVLQQRPSALANLPSAQLAISFSLKRLPLLPGALSPSMARFPSFKR